MYCKHCYKMIPDGSTFCPSCGKPQDSNAKGAGKKPIYKRWWFWLIIAILLFGIIGGGGSDEPVNLPNDDVVPQVNNIENDASAATAEKETNAVVILDSTTLGEKNALRSAKSYLSFSAFSYAGLIDQLEFEGYTTAEATYAANNCGADWNEQALLSAKSYLEFSAFSYSGLIDQLEFEGFTNFEATYGAMNCGANWREQAAKCAESYLEFSSFSRQGLIDQLLFEGFTQQEAEYGVKAVGY